MSAHFCVSSARPGSRRDSRRHAGTNYARTSSQDGSAAKFFSAPLLAMHLGIALFIQMWLFGLILMLLTATAFGHELKGARPPRLVGGMKRRIHRGPNTTPS